MKRSVIALIIIGVLVGAMVLTCPDEEKHVEKVSKEIVQSASDAVKDADMGIISGIINSAVGSIGEDIASIYVKGNLKVDDYVLFSLGKMNIEGEEQVVSVGLFNHVFSTGKAYKVLGEIVH